jgi:hypothetical protein
MRYCLILILSGISFLAAAQTYPLTGDVLNEKGEPMVYSTVVLLNPTDSTMAFFGIANQQGHFDIKNIKKGDYLLQTALLGYQTFSKQISIPFDGNSVGSIILKLKPVNLNEVKVVGENIPMWIKKDTVEFNAKAFKTNPDDVAEDLLKKLPGIEVDRSGNIKAMGEDVNKLYVDGKEFFGNDPKVATRNVPADALDKVQVYDRRSEQSEFTGIDDGSRNKTINLQLKEDKKNGLFGDLMAGGGTGEHYQSGAKAYRFTDKVQMAALGMLNNVNQMGFSFNDYLNFNGGIGSMGGHGGSMRISITSDNSFPIDFGQPISGLMTSGAGGANFSYSSTPNDRIFISYLGNGSKNKIEQTTTSRNYTGNSSFLQEDNLNEINKNEAHRINFGWRNRIDSTGNLVLDGNLSLTYGDTNSNLFTNSQRNQLPVNELTSETSDKADGFSGNASGSYILKLNEGKTMLKTEASGAWAKNLNKTRFENLTRYFETNQNISVNQYQDNQSGNYNFSGEVSLTQKLSKNIYFEPEFRIGNTVESLERTQGLFDPLPVAIDSLSPDFEKRYFWMRPTLGFRRVTEKSTLALTLQAESGKLGTSLAGQPSADKNFFYFTPSVSYELEYSTGRRIVTYYSSEINTPTSSQLLPVVNNINSLSLLYGNPNLKPEYSHRFNAHWILYDQFSFTSFFVSLNTSYTKDKINWSRTITQNLGFINRLINVDHDWRASANFDFSTPIRSLGIKINLSGEENWNKGLNLINEIENEYTTLSHRISLSADNRKKDKWDINSGVTATLTNSWYSIQESLNDRYINVSWFAELRWTPSEKWNFEATADITNYSAKSFDKSIKIPLLGAQISHHFLKNNRATLTLRGFDLLDKNTIVNRFGELNYLREIRSNSIGRYVMLSFTYRLNKFGENSGGIDIKMKKR